MMKPAPQMDSRQQLLERASVAILGEMLAGAGDPDRVLEATLRQALHLVEASRGLAVDHEKLVSAVGYAPEEGEGLRRELAVLLDPSQAAGQSGPALATEGGLHLYSGPRFTKPVPRPSGVVGMAGVITRPEPPGGPLAVVAVEREQPFTSAEISWLDEWLRLAATAVATAAEVARAARVEQGKLRATDLPLDRLEQVPPLEEIERLIIVEALRRTHNNKTRAAQALGITREGLRKKLQRLGLTPSPQSLTPKP